MPRRFLLIETSTDSMEIHTNFRLSLLGSLGTAAILSTSALADPVPDPVSGDLYVGFRVSGGIGGSTSYIVKLGLDTNFPTTPGFTLTLNLGNLGLDLSNTFGPDWDTREDLFWGIFGERPNNGNPIVYGSRERLNPNEPTAPWIALDLTARNSVDSQIVSVLTGIGGYRGGAATANSAFGTFQTNTGQASSYFFQVATPGTTDFGSLSQWGSIEGSFADGADGTVLDLYRIAGSGVTQRGSFSINEGGEITYFVVPEPATGLMAFAAGAVFLGLRRRRVALQAN